MVYKFPHLGKAWAVTIKEVAFERFPLADSIRPTARVHYVHGSPASDVSVRLLVVTETYPLCGEMDFFSNLLIVLPTITE
jgi:hypothetical protein